jgi:hypothetical protein
MRLTIVNFTKYNPRGDVKNPSWVRLDCNWWVDMWRWAPNTKLVWFMLLGLAKEGVVSADPEFMAMNLGIDAHDVEIALTSMEADKRITIEECDDDPASRAAAGGRGRERADAGVTDGRTGRTNETDGMSRLSADAEPSPAPLKLVQSDKPKLSPQGLMALWNDNRGALPACQKLSRGREKLARSRVLDIPDPDQWRQIIQRIAKSNFCSGANDRGWRADIDFILRPDTGTKVLEGKYDNREAMKKPQQPLNLFDPVAHANRP